MKQHFRKVICAVLLLTVLLSLAVSCGEEEEKVPMRSLEGYRVVRPDNATAGTTTVVTQFFTAFCETYGSGMTITTDFVKEGTKYTETEKEILIGNTNREESEQALTEAGTDWVIACVGTKIVINAKDNNALGAALYKFVHEVIVEDGVPEALHLSGAYSEDLPRYEAVEEKKTPVNFEKEARELIETIGNRTDYPLPYMSEETSTVFNPSSETDYYYNMTPQISYFNGKYIVAYTSGPVNESDLGQRVMICYSDDGVHWGEPKVLMEPPMGQFSQTLIYVSTMFAYSDRLVIYIGGWEYRPESLQNDGTLRPPKENLDDRLSRQTFRLTSFDGVTWGEPEVFGVFANVFRTQSGRIVATDGLAVFYTDDQTGTSEWKNAKVNTATAKDVNWLLEPNFYQAKDGKLFLLFRSNSDWLWASVSEDDGETWSALYKTNFTDGNSRAAFAVRPDGTVVYAGNPQQGSARIPLTVYLSEDGIHFDYGFRIRYNGNFVADKKGIEKGAYYQYPAILLTDEKLFVVYSEGKENIVVWSITWEELERESASIRSKYFKEEGE